MPSRKRIRVVFDAHAITPQRSGIGGYSWLLLQSLIDEHLQRIELFLYANGGIHPARSRADLDRITENIEEGALYHLRHQLELAFLLRRETYDVFHSPDFVLPILHGRTSVVPTLHDLIPIAVPEYLEHSLKVKILPVYRQYLRFITGRATRIITISRHSADDIRTHLRISENRIDIGGVGPSFEVLNGPLPASLEGQVQSRQYLLFVGRHDPYKGIGLLLRAFAAAREKDGLQGLKLVVAGRRDSRYGYDELITKLELEQTVIFTGYIPAEQMSDLYSHALVLVMPSLYEGFGSPVLDAMKHGVPVLSSNRSSLPEVAGGASLLFGPENSDEFCDALLRITKDSSLRADLIEKGYTRAAEFTWKKTAAATVETYRKCAASKE